MLQKIRILLICSFLIRPHWAAKVCVKSYVNGKWITKGDCGGPERMSALQKELELRAADEKKKKRIADRKWTVFQRRKYGNVSFFRGWDDYVNGFGNRDGDFWLGLEALHQMTKLGNMEMKIKMIMRTEVSLVAKYSEFRIGPGSDNYRLHVSGYSGNRTNGFQYHNNRQFSTKDADHDPRSSMNCASSSEGGWWYGYCGHSSNLNGNFNKTGFKGISWGGHPHNPLRFTEMKLRKRL